MALVEDIARATADALALGARLGTARDLPEADVLRRRIATVLDDVERRCSAAGVAKADLDDIRYALVAFLDEQIFRSSWPGKQDWMLEPLQLTYFNENIAGEEFFRRMEAVEPDPRRAHVLVVYHACLALGFLGKYAVRGGDGLAAMTESIGVKLRRGMAAGEAVSPHGLPPDAGGGRARRDLPAVALAISLVVLSSLAYAGLRARVSASAGATSSEMEAAGTSMAKSKGK